MLQHRPNFSSDQLNKDRNHKANCVARALYDNIAEASDEIAFRKGDLLTVLEQNTNGLEGWWLCCLRGRQGIAPGNRLRIQPGLYDQTGLGYSASPSSTTQSTNSLSTSVNLGSLPATETNVPTTPGTPKNCRRRSWHANPNKVVMPQRIGDVYLYDTPASTRILSQPDEVDSTSLIHHRSHQQQSSAYDVPVGFQGSYDTPNSPRLVKHHSTTYDHPRSHSLTMPSPGLTYDIPRAIPFHDYDVPSSSPTPDHKHQGTYDVPLSNQIITSSDNYVVPKSQILLKKVRHDISTPSNRSSGVSFISASSPSISPACSQSSLNASLSLSSLGGSNRSSLEQQSNELYDIPPSELRPVPNLASRYSPAKFGSVPLVPSSTSSPALTVGLELYDVPTNNSLLTQSQVYDTPPLPRPTVSAKTKKANILDGVYDVPPQVTRDISPEKPVDLVESVNRRHSTSSTDSRDSKDLVPSVVGKELPIDLDAAMEILVNVHQEVVGSNTKLFSFVGSTWRKREDMEAKMYDIKMTCQKLNKSLKEFLAFAKGALANSAHAADKSLAHKLGKLIRPLVDSDIIIQAAVESLDERAWQIVKLSQDDGATPDELDQLVACARGLVEDVRQVASFIQGNSPLIFKRSKLISESKTDGKPEIAPKPTDLQARTAGGILSPSKPTVQDRPLPPLPPNMIKEKKEEEPTKLTTVDAANDYDYVSLEPKEVTEQQEIQKLPNKDKQKSLENLVEQTKIALKESKKNGTIERAGKTRMLDFADQQILRFYATQMETHMAFLTKSIDAFFTIVKNNQPPKIFVGHIKFVVIGAEKLTFIGDTIQRNAHHSDVKAYMAQCSNALGEALKSLVINTKNAALQFPSVEAVQLMVDSVVDLSHLANELKQRIGRAANW